MASKVPVVKFENGCECPILGIGTWKSKPGEVTQAVKDAIDVGYCHIDCAWHKIGEAYAQHGLKTPSPELATCIYERTVKSKPGEVTQAVKDAIDIGYRHIDCAYVYGNEKEVGDAITAKIQEGVVKREDLFITSKLWNTFHRPDLVRGALQETLKNLQVSYVDLYLIHWPQAYKEEGALFPSDENDKIIFSDVDYVDTWKALEPLQQEGLARSLGVSNFNAKQITRVLEVAKIKPVVNQVECHPYLNQRRLKDFCEARGIKITAYSPLGSPDRPWAKPGDPQLMDDPKLKAIAERLQKTVAQVLIRYQIDRGNIVIPKSVTKSRIASNFDVLDFKLSKEDVDLIDSFDCNGRLVPMLASSGHKDHPFENDEF